MSRQQLFISYSHRDSAWIDPLLSALHAAMPDRRFVPWSDRELKIGEDFRKVIAEKISHAEAAVVLLSNDFLASEFIRGQEWPRLLDLADHAGKHIFGVLIRSCPIPDALLATHILPGPTKALSSFSGNDLDRELTNVAQSIAKRLASTGFDSSPGSRVVPPRRGLWAAVQAWLAYRRLRRRWPEFEAMFAANATRPPNSVLKDVPETFESRPQMVASTQPVDLIVGVSGSGKSTALRQILASLSGWLMLSLDVRSLKGEVFDAEVWRQVVMQFRRSMDTLDTRSAARALQHIARHRRLVIIAEDVDDFSDVRTFLDQLRTFFENNLRWHSGVKVIATARVAPEEHLGVVHVIRLEPLSADEAQHLFRRLCERYGVDIASAGSALASAFGSPVTRTPLVVTLSAVLARESGGAAADVEKILCMRVAVLLQQLIDRLASKDARGAGAVLENWYRQAAVAAWPRWERIPSTEIARKTQQGVDGPKLKELAIRGLLAAEELNVLGEVVTFPHRAMVDYVLATNILDFKTLGPLAQEPDTASEGVIDFLFDLCDAREKLLTLTRIDLPLPLRFYRRDHNLLRNPRFGERTAFMEELARTVAESIANRRATLTYDDWRDFCRAAAEASAAFAAALQSELVTQNPSVQGCRALVALHTDAGTDIARDWLRRNSGLLSGIDHPDIQAFYGATVAALPLSDAASATALAALLRTGQREQYGAVSRRLAADVAQLSERAVDLIVAAGDESLALLAFACMRTTVNVQRRIGIAVARTTGRALIPPSIYEGVDVGTVKRIVAAVRIGAPLLVELSARSVTGRNWGEASGRALEQVSHDELLDYDELCVLHRFFRADRGEPGFTFATPGSAVAEMVRMETGEHRKRGHASFAWITADGRVSAVSQNRRDEPATILIRRVRRLSVAAGRIRHFADVD